MKIHIIFLLLIFTLKSRSFNPLKQRRLTKFTNFNGDAKIGEADTHEGPNKKFLNGEGRPGGNQDKGTDPYIDEDDQPNKKFNSDNDINKKQFNTDQEDPNNKTFKDFLDDPNKVKKTNQPEQIDQKKTPFNSDKQDKNNQGFVNSQQSNEQSTDQDDQNNKPFANKQGTGGINNGSVIDTEDPNKKKFNDQGGNSQSQENDSEDQDNQKFVGNKQGQNQSDIQDQNQGNKQKNKQGNEEDPFIFKPSHRTSPEEFQDDSEDVQQKLNQNTPEFENQINDPFHNDKQPYSNNQKQKQNDGTTNLHDSQNPNQKQFQHELDETPHNTFNQEDQNKNKLINQQQPQGSLVDQEDQQKNNFQNETQKNNGLNQDPKQLQFQSQNQHQNLNNQPTQEDMNQKRLQQDHDIQTPANQTNQEDLNQQKLQRDPQNQIPHNQKNQEDLNNKKLQNNQAKLNKDVDQDQEQKKGFFETNEANNIQQAKDKKVFQNKGQISGVNGSGSGGNNRPRHVITPSQEYFESDEEIPFVLQEKQKQKLKQKQAQEDFLFHPSQRNQEDQSFSNSDQEDGIKKKKSQHEENQKHTQKQVDQNDIEKIKIEKQKEEDLQIKQDLIAESQKQAQNNLKLQSDKIDQEQVDKDKSLQSDQHLKQKNSQENSVDQESKKDNKFTQEDINNKQNNKDQKDQDSNTRDTQRLVIRQDPDQPKDTPQNKKKYIAEMHIHDKLQNKIHAVQIKDPKDEKQNKVVHTQDLNDPNSKPYEDKHEDEQNKEADKEDKQKENILNNNFTSKIIITLTMILIYQQVNQIKQLFNNNLKFQDLSFYIKSSQFSQIQIIIMETENLVKGSPIKSYYYVIYIYDQVMRIMFGLSILRLYANKPMTLIGLVRMFMFYHLFRMVINGFFYVMSDTDEKKYKMSFIFDILYSFTAFIFTIGALQVIRARMNSETLPLMLIPYIFVCFIRIFAGRSMELVYLPHPFFYFLESLQILFITLKFVYVERYSLWSSVLLGYIILASIMLLVAGILVIANLAFLVLGTLRFEFATRKNRHWVFAGLTFPFITKAVADFLLIVGFWLLLDSEILALNPEQEFPNKLLKIAAIIQMASAGLTLFIWFMFYVFLDAIPVDYYDFQIKEDVSKQQIEFRFSDMMPKKKDENQDVSQTIMDKEESLDKEKDTKKELIEEKV